MDCGCEEAKVGLKRVTGECKTVDESGDDKYNIQDCGPRASSIWVYISRPLHDLPTLPSFLRNPYPHHASEPDTKGKMVAETWPPTERSCVATKTRILRHHLSHCAHPICVRRSGRLRSSQLVCCTLEIELGGATACQHGRRVARGFTAADCTLKDAKPYHVWPAR